MIWVSMYAEHASVKQIQAIATWQAQDFGDITMFYAMIDLAQSILG